jgi:DAK2 domain fusion protein YloV
MATAPTTLTTTALHEALGVAERWLALNREGINAVNVYPVPDGDTGTNMLLTWRSARDGAAEALSESLEVYGRGFARAALLGARGNSGVILSQFVRGLAEALEGAETLDGARLARCLEAGATAAYTAVSTPVEGTMLTVMRDAATAAVGATAAGAELLGTLTAAADEADASVERTPELLPRLREAGVVDAGGLGVAALLRGIWYGLRGESLPEPPPVEHGIVDLEAVAHEGHGYCTEFVILGQSLDRDELLRALEAAGAESVLVVGDTEALHVHVHHDDPGPALSIGARAGALDAVKVDNMQLQHETWTAAHEGAGAAPPEFGMVAVVPGDGLAAALREIGPVERRRCARLRPAQRLERAHGRTAGRRGRAGPDHGGACHLRPRRHRRRVRLPPGRRRRRDRRAHDRSLGVGTGDRGHPVRAGGGR